jgi:hypothetical protein
MVDKGKFHLLPFTNTVVLCSITPSEPLTERFFSSIPEGVRCYMVGYPHGCFSVLTSEEQQALNTREECASSMHLPLSRW